MHEVIAGGLIAHAVGDYLVQSDWMATEKVRRWWPAVAHAASYGLPFLFLTRSIPALALIVVTHAVIDRYRLARHVCWVKNMVAPRRYRWRWADCRATGYPPDKPEWMAVWLMIIADNTMHVVINSVALVQLA
jgi:hypothetical protein